MMTLYRMRKALLGSFLLLLAACSQPGTHILLEEALPQPPTNGPATNPPVVASQTEPGSVEMDGTPMTPSPQASPSSGIEFLVKMAKEDLARRLSISEDQITLVEARAVVWPDSSLGCPQPGVRYLQVPQDGALILLQAQGTPYEYHNGGSRGLFLCEKRFLKTEKPPQIDITDLTPPGSDNTHPPGEDQ